jgi:hypothetical protein
MRGVQQLAPNGNHVVDYDRRHLALYAALLDADDAGCAWDEAASDLMHIDPSADWAADCWRSHLARARWIVGEGLDTALLAFGCRETGATTK